MLRQGSLAPFQTLRPNKAHPLFKGLISAWTPGQLWSRIPRPANGGTPVTGPFGLGASFNGTSDSVALGPRALVHTSANSRFALVKVGTASGAKNISAGGNGGLGFRINGTTLEVVHSGVAILFSATSAVSTGEFCSVGYTYLTGASSPGEIYKNGTRISAGSASATTTDNGTDFLGQSGASGQYWDGHIYLHLAWNRVLTAAEMRMLDDDPWSIFRPSFVPVKTASSGVSGSGSPTNANDTSAGTGTTTVVGTSSTTNANDTSAGTGTTTVTGTVNYTNNNDTCAGSGTAGAITGTVNYTNNNDTAVGAGWAGIVTGTGSPTNANDTSTGEGTTPRARRGAAKPLRKGYIIRGKKYWLTDDELAIMVALELETIKRSDIKVPTKGRIKPIPTATFEMVRAVAKKLDELASIGLDDDEDEEEELLLML